MSIQSTKAQAPDEVSQRLWPVAEGQPVSFYNLAEVKKELEARYGSKIDLDDPSFVAMAGVDLIFRHTLDSSLEWIQGHIRIATAEFKQRLDMAANDKKRDLRQEVISLANVIHDKLKVETDAINRPILARIEDLRQISVSIGANYSQYRWHDRIIGLLCASLLFLAAIAFGMMFVLFKR